MQGNHANVKRTAITNVTGGYTTGVPTFIMITDSGERNLANWAKKHLFCPLHIPIATKVEWDQEQRKDVVVEATNYKSKRFLKKAIVNKL